MNNCVHYTSFDVEGHRGHLDWNMHRIRSILSISVIVVPYLENISLGFNLIFNVLIQKYCLIPANRYKILGIREYVVSRDGEDWIEHFPNTPNKLFLVFDKPEDQEEQLYDSSRQTPTQEKKEDYRQVEILPGLYRGKCLLGGRTIVVWEFSVLSRDIITHSRDIIRHSRDIIKLLDSAITVARET